MLWFCWNIDFYTSCCFSGLSGKSQVLFALVFTTRYLDLFINFISVYNTVMKVIYIVCSYATIYLMYMKFKATYDSNHDTFRIEFLVVPVGGLACLVNHEFTVLEVSISIKVWIRKRYLWLPISRDNDEVGSLH